MGNTTKGTVMVALSGGIDSSVAALLLKEEGYAVRGVTFSTSQGENKENLKLAESIAQDLQIPWQALDLSEEFKEIVIDYFCQEYTSGRTPNPCIICNWKIKFGLLLERARLWGADYLATGHYVLKEYHTANKKFILKKGKDKSKDQSYFLYRLNQEILSQVLFPLGKFKKNQVRLIAERYKLKNHSREESQEICFVPDNNYKAFLTQYLKKEIKRGKFIDREGRILGEHQGIPFYTIGQRRGLGISADRRKYVIEMDKKHNTITLGEEKDLYRKELRLSHLNFISGNLPSQPLKVEAKIRYNCKGSSATIYPQDQNMVLVIFDEPQRAITPGQSAVFYLEDVLLGGGIIEIP